MKRGIWNFSAWLFERMVCEAPDILLSRNACTAPCTSDLRCGLVFHGCVRAEFRFSVKNFPPGWDTRCDVPARAERAGGGASARWNSQLPNDESSGSARRASERGSVTRSEKC